MLRFKGHLVRVGLTALWLTACTPPPCTPPTASGDPSAIFEHAVTSRDYAVTFPAPDGTGDTELQGSIYYPAHTSSPPTGYVYVGGRNVAFDERIRGAAPLVILAHGVNGVELSYKGYAALQSALARAGMIAVSVHLGPLPSSGEDAWARRLRAHVSYLMALHRDAASPLHGRFDFNRLGVFGHSRGGVEVMRLAAAPPAGLSVRALLTVGTDNNPEPAPAGIPFMTILPAAEGASGDPHTGAPTAPGFPDLDGAVLYDLAVPAPLKVQLYVHRANHNHWNRYWRPTDSASPSAPVLTRDEQELILKSYGSAFFKTFLVDLPSTPLTPEVFLLQRSGPVSYLTGHQLPDLRRAADPRNSVLPIQIDPSLLHLSYQSSTSVIVENHEQTGTSTNTVGGATTVDGLLATEASAISTGLPGRGTVLSVSGCRAGTGCTFRSELPTPHRNLSARSAILLRVAEDLDSFATVPLGALDFDLGLETSAGTAWTNSASVGGVPRPFYRGDSHTHPVLSTLRFSLSCFSAVESSLGDVRAIVIRVNLPAGRRVMFDDLLIE
jgi:hypothetical protein